MGTSFLDQSHKEIAKTKQSNIQHSLKISQIHFTTGTAYPRDLSIIAEVHPQVSQAKGRRSIVIPSEWDASSDSPLKKNDKKNPTTASLRALIVTCSLPVGKSLRTSSGYAMLVQPTSLPQISMHFSGTLHATRSRDTTKAANW